MVLLMLLSSILAISAEPNQREIMSVESPEFANQIAFGNVVFSQTGVDSLLACLDLCLREARCETIFFRSSDGFCQLNSVAYCSDSLKPAQGFKYYETAYGRCPHNNGYMYNKLSKLCYKFYMEINLTWPLSRQVCNYDGGDLVALDTIEKYDHIVETIHACPGFTVGTGFMIGASDEDVEGDWRWVNGQQLPLNSSLWNDLEPNNDFGTQDYAKLSKFPTLRIDDVGTNARSFFICEITQV